MRLILIFPLCLIGAKVFAQEKQITNQSLYWVRYYNQLKINKSFTWHNELDERRFLSSNIQHHFIGHSRLHYKLSPSLELGAGLTYSLQSPQIPSSNSSLVVSELRPTQEINYSFSTSPKLKIQQRIRIDERFIYKNYSNELLDGYCFNLRWRYRVQLNYLLNRADSRSPTTLKANSEIMLNTGRKVIYNQFDQRRLYVGIEQGFGKNISAELGYMNLFQQRASGIDFYNRNIIRFTVYHKINLRKNESK